MAPGCTPTCSPRRSDHKGGRDETESRQQEGELDCVSMHCSVRGHVCVAGLHTHESAKQPSLEVNVNDFPPSSTMCVFSVCSCTSPGFGFNSKNWSRFHLFCFCSKNLSWSMAVLCEFIFLNQLLLPMQKTLAVENVVKINSSFKRFSSHYFL